MEITPSTEVTPTSSPVRVEASDDTQLPPYEPPEYAESIKSINSAKSTTSSGFRAGSVRRRGSKSRGSRGSSMSASAKANNEGERPHTAREADWGIGDDARMGLE